MSLEIVSGDAAHAAVANEPMFLMVYGGPGTGKTTEAVATFGREAFFVQCEPGALKPIVARGLPVPDHTKGVVQTWDDLAAAVAFAGQHRDRYKAVIIDTISTWTATVYKQLEAKYKGWAIPVAARNMLLGLRDGARALGIHVLMIAHEAPPWYDDKGELKALGGPLMTPRSAQGLFVPLVDSMLRVSTLRTTAGPQRVFFPGGMNPWPQGLGLPPADMGLWHVKNRDGCNEQVVPADLKAYLQARQPRYVGL